MADNSGKLFNRNIRLSKGSKLFVNDIVIVDGDGNIDAPVTTTDLTTSGNTTLGDASTDTITLNGTTTATAPITVGLDDTGHDVKYFGATSGKSWLWDESADKMICTGTATITDLVTLTAGIDAKVIFAATETIAAGGTTTAADLTKTLHDVDADAGGDIVTLADGIAGQIMIFVMKSATGTLTLTPATFLGGTSVTFNAAGDTVMMVFQDTLGWSIIGGNSFAVI